MNDLTNPTSLENARRRATMAAILGLDATTIRVEEVASQLMQEGVIVDVSLSRWRARASLDLDDLGLPPLAEDEAESIRSIFRLGEKRLLPESYFKRLAACEKVLYRTLAACRREWGLGRHRAIFQKSRFGFVMRYSRFSPTNC